MKQRSEIDEKFIIYILINCLVKMTKDNIKASGNSFVQFLMAINFEKFIKKDVQNILLINYQDLILEKKNAKKVQDLWIEIINNPLKTNDLIKNIKRDNNLLGFIEWTKPVYKEVVSFFEEVDPTFVTIKKVNGLLEKCFENVEVIDNITDVININKILKKNESLNATNILLVDEVISVLKGRVDRLNKDSIEYYNNILLERESLSINIEKIKLKIEEETSKDFANKIFNIHQEIKQKKPNLENLMVTFEQIDSYFDLKKNLDLKFKIQNGKDGYYAIFSIELYLCILGKSKYNTVNGNSLNKLREKIEKYFLESNNLPLFSTLLNKCIQNDYINESFKIMELYPIQNSLEIFIAENSFKKKEVLIEYIQQKYDRNIEVIKEIEIKLPTLMGEDREKKEKQLEIKKRINNEIFINLEKYSEHNDLINLYALEVK